jgi:hypothetical protein
LSKGKTDKSKRHKDRSGYHHPMGVFPIEQKVQHLSIAPSLVIFPSSCPSSPAPNVAGFRLAVASAGGVERESIANPNLIGIYSCGLKIIDVQKHIRTACVVCDKSEATVCLPHFKFSSAHLFPLRVSPSAIVSSSFFSRLPAAVWPVAFQSPG